MLKDKARYRIDVPEGRSLNDALDALLNRRGAYANGWVLCSLGGEARYVAYDEIAQVRAVERD
jgi:hypothetical protein